MYGCPLLFLNAGLNKLKFETDNFYFFFSSFGGSTIACSLFPSVASESNILCEFLPYAHSPFCPHKATDCAHPASRSCSEFPLHPGMWQMAATVNLTAIAAGSALLSRVKSSLRRFWSHVLWAMDAAVNALQLDLSPFGGWLGLTPTGIEKSHGPVFRNASAMKFP